MAWWKTCLGIQHKKIIVCTQKLGTKLDFRKCNSIKNGKQKRVSDFVARGRQKDLLPSCTTPFPFFSLVLWHCSRTNQTSWIQESNHHSTHQSKFQVHVVQHTSPFLPNVFFVLLRTNQTPGPLIILHANPFQPVAPNPSICFHLPFSHSSTTIQNPEVG